MILNMIFQFHETAVSLEMPALLKGNFRRYSLDLYYLATTVADILTQVKVFHNFRKRKKSKSHVVILPLICSRFAVFFTYQSYTI